MQTLGIILQKSKGTNNPRKKHFAQFKPSFRTIVQHAAWSVKFLGHGSVVCHSKQIHFIESRDPNKKIITLSNPLRGYKLNLSCVHCELYSIVEKNGGRYPCMLCTPVCYVSLALIAIAFDWISVSFGLSSSIFSKSKKLLKIALR